MLNYISAVPSIIPSTSFSVFLPTKTLYHHGHSRKHTQTITQFSKWFQPISSTIWYHCSACHWVHMRCRNTWLVNSTDSPWSSYSLENAEIHSQSRHIRCSASFRRCTRDMLPQLATITWGNWRRFDGKFILTSVQVQLVLWGIWSHNQVCYIQSNLGREEPTLLDHRPPLWECPFKVMVAE